MKIRRDFRIRASIRFGGLLFCSFVFCLGCSNSFSVSSPDGGLGFWSSLWIGVDGLSKETGKDLVSGSGSLNDKLEIAYEELPPPISVEIMKELVQDGVLRIGVRIVSKALIHTKDVVVEAVGLVDGQVREKESRDLSDIMPGDVIHPGESIDLEFKLPSKDLKEYQVRCFWNDASDKIRERLESRSEWPDESLVLSDIVISSEPEHCLQQLCDYRYTVEGRLVNYSKDIATDINLALGIFWNEQDRDMVYPKPFSPQEVIEDKIALSDSSGDLLLYPGQEKIVRLKVDRAISDAPGGRFVPHLRILSCRFDAGSVP